MKSSSSLYSTEDIRTLSVAINKIIVGELGLSVPTEDIENEQLKEIAKKINSVLSVMRKRITDERMAEGAEVFRRKKLQLEIENFSNTIKLIAMGDLNKKVAVEKGGELESLANSFNAMTEDLKRLREKTEESRVRSLVESLSDGVIMFNLEHKVTMINLAAKRMTNIAKLNCELFEFIRPLSFGEESRVIEKKDFNKKVEAILRSGEMVRVGEANLGQSILEVVAIPVYDYNKNIIGGALIMQDITHINQVARMKTEFISIVSHQLRTPINEINWNIEMLLIDKAGNLDVKQRGYLEDAYSGSKRMLQLVNDLLSVSGLESGRVAMKLWPIQLEELISTVINDVDALTRSRKREIIFTKPRKKLPKISIDPNLMRHVIYNLIDNAITYSSLESSPRVSVVLKKEKEMAVIVVKDSGIGISKEEKGRVFEKFFRGKDAHKVVPNGSGLGLYAVKMITELFGGDVRVESAKNRGAAFYVRIPFSEAGVLARKS